MLGKSLSDLYLSSHLPKRNQCSRFYPSTIFYALYPRTIFCALKLSALCPYSCWELSNSLQMDICVSVMAVTFQPLRLLWLKDMSVPKTFTGLDLLSLEWGLQYRLWIVVLLTYLKITNLPPPSSFLTWPSVPSLYVPQQTSPERRDSI